MTIVIAAIAAASRNQGVSCIPLAAIGTGLHRLFLSDTAGFTRLGLCKRVRERKQM